MKRRFYGFAIILAFVLNPYLSYQVRVGKGSIFQKCFTEPFETLVCVMYNGDFMPFSSNDENRVDIGTEQFIEYLKTEGYSLGDVAIIAHNHLIAPRFSDNDMRFLKKLRSRGFKGSFCLYHAPTKKVIKVLRDGSDN